MLRVKCSITNTMSINNNCTRRGSTITTVLFPNSNSKTNRHPGPSENLEVPFCEIIYKVSPLFEQPCDGFTSVQLVLRACHTQNTTGSILDAVL